MNPKPIENEEMISLIPHRGKMLLISRVKDYDLNEHTLCAEAFINKDSLFFDPSINAIPAWVGFEFMAQAISVYSGIILRERGEKPKVGFIMSVSSMQIEIPFFKEESLVEIKVKQTSCLGYVYNYTACVFLENKKVMEGKLTVMDATDEQINAMAS